MSVALVFEGRTVVRIAGGVINHVLAEEFLVLDRLGKDGCVALSARSYQFCDNLAFRQLSILN